jgi:hypothetical protein
MIELNLILKFVLKFNNLFFEFGHLFFKTVVAIHKNVVSLLHENELFLLK